MTINLTHATCPNDGTRVANDGDYCAACNVSAQASDLFFRLHHGMGDAQAIVAALRAMGQWQEWCPVCGYESDVDGICVECRTYRVSLDKAPTTPVSDRNHRTGVMHDIIDRLAAPRVRFNGHFGMTETEAENMAFDLQGRGNLEDLSEYFNITTSKENKTMGYYANEMVTIVDGIVDAIIDDGGATIDIDTGAVMTLPDGGYVVAIGAPYEWCIESTHCDFTHVVIDAIQQFFNHAATWARDLHAATPIHMGVWVDGETDKLYLDLVQVTTDIDIAMQAARERNQLAIFDTTTGQDIVVTPLVVTLRKASDPVPA